MIYWLSMIAIFAFVYAICLVLDYLASPKGLVEQLIEDARQLNSEWFPRKDMSCRKRPK